MKISLWAFTILLRKSCGEISPTSRKMENDTLFTNIQERLNTGNRKNTALAQFSNTSKQQITTNDSNSTNNSAQRLVADQVAMRTKLQRDSSHSEDIPHGILPPSIYRVPDRSWTLTWKSLEKSGSRLLIEISRKLTHFRESSICRQGQGPRIGR
ncbi:hypothetical protein AVEN_14311-1 [Araneus ventricosus]|uniref:Uncharacterized protein n=1 Tax=Araneus ventricosus TaxID=182803 RepID=A0A4Y2VAE6_ARAVE|nr:hypothetical protein AVEN_14311-1 [Araneus ventricosus]